MAIKKAKKTLTFHIITLFPESLSSYINESIVARAQKEKHISIKFYNPRDFVKPTKSQSKNEKPYLRVDDRPYGGGPGMVMQALPVVKAIEKAVVAIQKKKGKALLVFLSPTGTQFTNEFAAEIPASYTDVVILCGRYEGVDARVKKIFKMVDITVGPFVTTGGELPAMLMIDVISRQIPGVLGNFDSREESRASSSDVYTRPEVLEYKGKKYKVPEVLLSGDHKAIDEWRNQAGGVR
ncbi:MAG: tRNA (guanine(37)-N(1))-methyltransferase [Candidatus Taylorbacteria bacterium]|nr:tRNA (guanine(37)-N(1))-methyltransferase [Candidatus Taylorbacteria bacterium]